VLSITHAITLDHEPSCTAFHLIVIHCVFWRFLCPSLASVFSCCSLSFLLLALPLSPANKKPVSLTVLSLSMAPLTNIRSSCRTTGPPIRNSVLYSYFTE